MTSLPVAQQHEMVPSHERFLSTQFKEEGNIEKMRERLIERAYRSTHWLNELVQELTDPSDTELLDNDTATPDYYFDVVSEALSELESLHPELFENLPLPENEAQDDILTTDIELTDDQMAESMEQWEEEMKVASYAHLLDNEVRAFR